MGIWEADVLAGMCQWHGNLFTAEFWGIWYRGGDGAEAARDEAGKKQ
jgi:hypothetical protein